MRPGCYADSRGRFDHELFGPGSAFYTRMLLPPSLARLRVEGGAPYLSASGLPQYPPDDHDSARSHPACSRPSPLADPCGISPLQFGSSAVSGVTHDMRRLLPSLIGEVEAKLAWSRARCPRRVGEHEVPERQPLLRRLTDLRYWQCSIPSG